MAGIRKKRKPTPEPECGWENTITRHAYAKLAGIDVQVVYNMIKRQGFPYHVDPSGQVRVVADEVDDWMLRRRTRRKKNPSERVEELYEQIIRIFDSLEYVEFSEETVDLKNSQVELMRADEEAIKEELQS